MRAVDTNVLVRLITRDDARQAARAEQFIEEGAWVALLTLQEATWVLEAVYDRGAKEVATAVEMILDHAKLTIQDEDVAAAALEQFRRRPAAGYSDCLMLEVARRAGHIPLGTFDRVLGSLPGAERLKG